MLFNRQLRSAKCHSTRARSAFRLSVEALDDRIMPSTLSVGDATVVEGNDGTRFALMRVTLDAPSKQTVTVNYATGNGTAVAGNDYFASTGRLTFARGETSKTIQVAVLGDRIAEADENFYVNLFSPKGARIADGRGVVTIADDEPRIWVSGWSGYAGETGTTLATFTVHLSATYDEAVTFNYSTVNGTAIAAVDYLPNSGTLTFAAGETTKTITVEVLRAAPAGTGNRTFGVGLSNVSRNANVMGWLGEGVILDSTYDNTDTTNYYGSY